MANTVLSNGRRRPTDPELRSLVRATLTQNPDVPPSTLARQMRDDGYAVGMPRLLSVMLEQARGRAVRARLRVSFLKAMLDTARGVE